MAKTCSTGDGNPVWSKGLCLNHWRQEYGKPLPRATKPLPRPTKPIKQVSERKKIADKQYKTIRALWLPHHPQCEAKLSGCHKQATEVHHLKGREGELLLITTYWLAVCPPCHQWITEHSKEAIELGLSMRRNGCLPPVEKSG